MKHNTNRIFSIRFVFTFSIFLHIDNYQTPNTNAIVVVCLLFSIGKTISNAYSFESCYHHEVHLTCWPMFWIVDSSSSIEIFFKCRIVYFYYLLLWIHCYYGNDNDDQICTMYSVHCNTSFGHILFPFHSEFNEEWEWEK